MEKVQTEFSDLKQNGEEKKPIKWLRSRDVRKMLGIGDSSLQSFRVKGLIPAYKLGDMWFYREDEITNALLNGMTNREGVKNESR